MPPPPHHHITPHIHHASVLVYIHARVTTFGYLFKPCCFLVTATRHWISTSAFPLPVPSVSKDKTAHADDKMLNVRYIYISMYLGYHTIVPGAT